MQCHLKLVFPVLSKGQISKEGLVALLQGSKQLLSKRMLMLP